MALKYYPTSLQLDLNAELKDDLNAELKELLCCANCFGTKEGSTVRVAKKYLVRAKFEFVSRQAVTKT